MKTVNIICHDNGSGLSRDTAIVTEVLEDAGYEVFYTNNKEKQYHRRKFDMNIFIEILDRKYFYQGTRNIFIPNPEWFFLEWRSMLRKVDMIIAKTMDCKNIFHHHKNVVYTSFTSQDRKIDVEKKKDFFHSAGNSLSKGTNAITDAWKSNRGLPFLNLIHKERVGKMNLTRPNINHIIGRVEEEKFKKLQNESLFHICASKYEGFGHYINEAKSTGGIVLTPGLTPMKELIGRSGILMRPFRMGKMRLATTAIMAKEGIIKGVETALGLSEDQIAERSALARQEFLDNDKFFKERFINAIA